MPDQFKPIPELTEKEIQDAIDRLKKGKARDSSGIRAEQLKNCSDKTKEKSEKSSTKSYDKKTARRGFGEKFVSRSSTRKVTEKMQEITDQYAACQCYTSCLPQYYTRVLYARLAPSLHKIQPPDQGGFRPNHRTEDHLMVYKILEQRCREWGVPLYISTIDFSKAFDRIKHSALWSSLQHFGVEPAYVRLLQRLYSQQEGTVLTDKECDVFSIKRGTKQGDPLSSLLFNSVLQFSLESDLKRWQENHKKHQTERQKRRLPDELKICG